MTIKVTYNVTDVYVSETISATYINISYEAPSGGSSVWGGITGTLSNQTDLQNALNAKFDDPTGTTAQYLRGDGTLATFPTITSGTVTSVGLTMPTAFSVANSPVTSSGTLAVTGAGDTTQYLAGDGSLVAFPIAGQSGTLVREVRNVTGATLTKGTVVYINGASGNKPTVAKALATSDATSAQTFGLIQADIPNNSNGYLVAFGDLDGLNTSAFAEGVQLYLSATTAGEYTSVKQYAPNHLVYIGVVTRQHVNQGRIEVRIQNGYELDEIHDVAAQTPSNNDALIYETATALWKNKSIATALGYTPISGTGAAGQVAYFTGATTQAGNNNLFWDITNGRLGVGTATPLHPLDVTSAGNTILYIRGGSATALSRLVFGTSANNNRGFIDYDNTSGARFMSFKTEETERMQITATNGNVHIGTFSSDSGQRLQVTGTGYFSDSVGIGSTSLTAISLLVSKNISGSAVGYGIHQNGQIQSGVNFGLGIANTPSIAASLTISSYRSFYTANPSIGAASTVSELVGYYVESNFVGGTATYGFQGAIPSGTGRWNLYMNGTANNYMAGSLAVGTTTFNDNANPYKAVVFYNTSGSAGGGFMVSANQAANGANAMVSAVQWALSDGTKMKPSGFFFNYATLGQGNRANNSSGNFIASTQIAGANFIITNNNAYINHTDINSTSNDYVNYQAYLYVQRNSGTVNVNGYQAFRSVYQFAVGSETITNFYDFVAAQPTLAASALVTNRYGLFIDFNNTQVTNAWGLYQTSSTVKNYLNGELLLGSTTSSGEKLQVTGTAKITGNLAVDTDTLFVDAANNNVGIGTTTPNTFSPLHVNKSQNTLTSLFVTNNNAGIGAHAGVRAGLNPSNFAADYISVFIMGTGFGVTGLLKPKTGVLENFGTNLVISNYNDSEPISFTTGTSRVEKVRIFNNGNVQIQNGGTYTDIASAKLALNTTTQGFLPPRMTTTQKNAISSPAAGLMVYDTTLNKLCVYTTAWETITSL
jgi:hypothetical protein